MADNKVNRVQAVLRGEHPDRPPFSCWHHFDPDSAFGQPALDAHLRHVEALDVDFLKVMNDNKYPREQPGAVIETTQDLQALKEHGPETEGFSRQFDLLRKLAERFGGEMLMTTTLFNAWAVLRRLCAPPSDVHKPPVLDSDTKGGTDGRDAKITELLRQDRAAVAAAIGTISRTLAGFAKACLDAGADGIFLSVRDDWVDTEANGTSTYDEMVRQADLAILEAASGGTLNMLHICGRPRDFGAFARYPVDAVNWADRCAPPSIAAVKDTLKPALCGGLNNLDTLPNGSSEACAAEALDALAQAGDRPMLVTPGCTYDPQLVPLASLRAARDAVRGGSAG